MSWTDRTSTLCSLGWVLDVRSSDKDVIVVNSTKLDCSGRVQELAEAIESCKNKDKDNEEVSGICV